MPRPLIDISCPTDHAQCAICLSRTPKKLMVLRLRDNNFAICSECRERLREVV